MNQKQYIKTLLKHLEKRQEKKELEEKQKRKKIKKELDLLSNPKTEYEKVKKEILISKLNLGFDYKMTKEEMVKVATQEGIQCSEKDSFYELERAIDAVNIKRLNKVKSSIKNNDTKKAIDGEIDFLKRAHRDSLLLSSLQDILKKEGVNDIKLYMPLSTRYKHCFFLTDIRTTTNFSTNTDIYSNHIKFITKQESKDRIEAGFNDDLIFWKSKDLVTGETVYSLFYIAYTYVESAIDNPASRIKIDTSCTKKLLLKYNRNQNEYKELLEIMLDVAKKYFDCIIEKNGSTYEIADLFALEYDGWISASKAAYLWQLGKSTIRSAINRKQNFAENEYVKICNKWFVYAQAMLRIYGEPKKGECKRYNNFWSIEID